MKFLIASIPLILGPACADRHRVTTSNFVLIPETDPMPAIVDGSPLPCPECELINGQPALKISERDFVSIKRKLLEYKKKEREYYRPLLDGR